MNGVSVIVSASALDEAQALGQTQVWITHAGVMCAARLLADHQDSDTAGALLFQSVTLARYEL